jgi:hypothetical protein
MSQVGKRLGGLKAIRRIFFFWTADRAWGGVQFPLEKIRSIDFNPPNRF